MPKADIEHTASRRNFLGHLAGGATIVAVAASTARVAGAVQADNPDAELIALCAEFDALERRKQTLVTDYAGHDGGIPEELLASIHDDQECVLDLITAKRATTQLGFAAMARTIVLYADDLVESDYGDDRTDRNNGYWDDRLIAMLLGDMTAVSVMGGAA